MRQALDEVKAAPSKLGVAQMTTATRVAPRLFKCNYFCCGTCEMQKQLAFIFIFRPLPRYCSLYLFYAAYIFFHNDT
jgi:hypothetical protein